jgi:hypothetical protein
MRVPDGPGGGFTVHPAALRAAGAASHGCAERVRAGTPAVLEADQQAAAGLPGWQTARELGVLNGEWSLRAQLLIRRLDATGNNLEQVADSYVRTDAQVQGSMGG